jgi:outer membrane lipoprotein-sorting protein
MKRFLSWTTAALILVSLAALPGYGQTAQDILNKVIDAMGGRKALTAIKDTTMTGTYELMAMSMSGTFTMYQKEPNKMRADMEISMMNMMMTQAFDGQKAMWTNPQNGGAVEEMPEAQSKAFAREAMGNDAYLHPEKYKITYALKPKVQIEGKDYIVLEQTMADGHKTTIFIDPATYLVYKAETVEVGMAGTDVKSESYPSDYKKVNGVMMAHSIRTVQDGTDFMKLTFTKVTFNSNLEDSLFTLGK